MNTRKRNREEYGSEYTEEDKAFSRLPAMLAEVGVSVSKVQLAQFRIHYDLLLFWNQKTNLTAIRKPEEILRRHLVESAYLTKVVNFGPGTLVDVGSGAGFPGIPVKVLCPQTKVILVESVQKKAAFLKEVARAIGTSELEVAAARVEDLALQAQWITMRAVKLTAEVLQILRDMIVPRGTLALFTEDAPSTIDFDWHTVKLPVQLGRTILI